jgi:spermidine synthase
MESRFRSSLFSWLIYAAFFASGAASLAAEVTWNRMLIVVVGNSLSATAMIIVVFMGGLGLGSYLGGRVFGSRRASLIPYLLLETTVGLYVLLSPVLFDALSTVFASLAETVHNRAGLTAVRVVITMAALLVPATLMGATFPAIISGAARTQGEGKNHGGAATDRLGPESSGTRTGYLYSINTLGAALGCFAAGYYMLVELGVRITLTCAFGLYLAAALCALLARLLATGRLGSSTGLAGARAGTGLPSVLAESNVDPGPTSRRPTSAAAIPETASAGGRLDPGQRRLLGLATFGIGFVALAYEVLLTRLSILYLGNSVSVFPLVLTAFLLGTGISAVVGTRLYSILCPDIVRARRLFGTAALAAGAAVMAIPYLLLTDWVLGVNRFTRFADSAPQNPWPILLIITAPTILIGALLPIAIRMLQPRDRGEATRGASGLYALNTAGGLLGAGVANHYLVPTIGVQGTLVCLTSICAAAGTFSLLRPGRGARGRLAGVLGVATLAAILAIALPSMMHLYAGKIAAATGARSTQVRLVREGRAATVAVIDQQDPTVGTYRDMYLNGVEEASTRYWHTQLFKLLGILPILAHQSDGLKQVLVVAFGAGITAGSTLASDEVSSLDVVDLNPDIEGINDLFTDVNGDVFHKPRFHFHTDDGRNFLVTSGKQYDVIISDSTHPRAYDSWILYTEEFYRSVRRRLAPGGVFAQWVPVLGSMRGRLLRIHLNTFRRVFPNATFWYVYGSDQAFLLATPEPLMLDVPRLSRRLSRLPEWFRADEYQINTPARLAGFFWMDSPALGRMIGDETRVNTDDVHYFDKQSALFPAPPQGRLPFFQASALPYFQGGPETLTATIQSEQETARQVALYGFLESKDDLYRAYCSRPDNGNVRFFMAREFADSLPDHRTFCVEQSVKEYRTAVAHHPADPLALNALADVLAENDVLEEALPLAERAVALASESGAGLDAFRRGMILDTYGWILFRQKKAVTAREVLRRSAALIPDHPIVLYHLGAAEMACGNSAKGRELLQEALRAKSGFAGAEEARRLLTP